MTKSVKRNQATDTKVLFVVSLLVVSLLLMLAELSIEVTPMMITLLCVTYVALGIIFSIWHGKISVVTILEYGLTAALIQLVALSIT